MVKVAVVGKGQLTNHQIELLKRALQKYFNTTDYQIVKEIPTLQSTNDIPQDIDFVVSFIGVPVVVDTLNKWKRFVNQNGVFGIFKTRQIGTYDEPNPELEKIADIKFTKTAWLSLKQQIKEEDAKRNNKFQKYVYSKTESLQINPIIRIEFEDEIS